MAAAEGSFQRKSLFKRYVQIGRLCVISRGADEGKICTIVDVVDKNRALVDGPKSFNGVERQMMNFNDLQLTDFRLNVRLNARAKTIVKALTTAKDGETSVLDQWKASKWAKKIEGREVKASLTDLERFRAMRKRQAVSKAVRKAIKA
eukprot:TRINITY_DN37053_c0_g1_i1.p2 TRINITY_DN37053_c0_g1~~TRINITY_DN37053_c0_g1_i1.p2  ORF type:complete len:157 (-),score=30.83 TRINITY_DN37053_c0_g1_i1:110-553(-)